MSTTKFADLIGGMTAAPEQSLTFSEDWSQGRAIYGGLVGAVLYQAMRGQVPAERDLRAMTVAFVGPVAPETATVTSTVLRQGKSVTQMEARIIHHDQVCATATASFGGGRDSDIVIPGTARPVAPPPDQGLQLPQIPGMTPVFLQHYDLVWTQGGVPFSNTPQPDFAGWCRYRDPVGQGDAVLIGLLDVWPPSVLPMLNRPAPASSMTWSFDLLNPPGDAGAGDDWWYYDVHTQGARDGFAQADARLWRPDGQLAAVSRQSVVVFDKR